MWLRGGGGEKRKEQHKGNVVSLSTDTDIFAFRNNPV